MAPNSGNNPPVTDDIASRAWVAYNDQQDEVSTSPAVSALFSDIHTGIVSVDVKKFSTHLAKQVYLNLRGVESGYFSQNQAFYILDSYLSARHVVQFTFSTINGAGPTPYATGGGIFMRHGRREIFQVYTSLSKQDDQWVITQLNVY